MVDYLPRVLMSSSLSDVDGTPLYGRYTDATVPLPRSYSWCKVEFER